MEQAVLAQHVHEFARHPERVNAAGLQTLIDCLLLVQSSACPAEYDRLEQSAEIDYPLRELARSLNIGTGAAADRLCVGDVRARGDLELSAGAVLDGNLGFAQMALIARAHRDVGNHRGFNETALVRMAAEQPLRRFRQSVEHLRHALDRAGTVGGEVSASQGRHLVLSTDAAGGLSLSGWFEPEAGAILRETLEPLARRSGPADDRTTGRRAADALLELAAQSPSGAARRPLLQVTTTLDTLLGQAGSPAAEVDGRTLLSGVAVERLACDCTVARIVFGPASVVVDAGRAERVVKPATRRALWARDRGCRWPGCERDARRTQAHHLVHWTQGGPTDLANLVLLCPRHHWMVHEGGWQLARLGDGTVTAAPDLDHAGFGTSTPRWSNSRAPAA